MQNPDTGQSNVPVESQASTLNTVEGILAVLEEGSVTGTNKYGLLLALIDLAPNTDLAQRTLSFPDIAEKLIEIHWNHADEVPWHGGSRVLKQVRVTNLDNTTLVSQIAELKSEIGKLRYEQAVKQTDRRRWHSMRKSVEKETIRNPLAKLQYLGKQQTSFLYDIDMSDRCIRFIPGALEDLVQYGKILRPLVESQFISFVMRCNGDPLSDVDLYAHFFGAERYMPGLAVRRGLWALQGGVCLYTGIALPEPEKSSSLSIDHVAPWSRVRLSRIENFVITTNLVNIAKRNALLAPELLATWVDFVTDHKDDLAELAAAHAWPSDLSRVQDALISLYTVGNIAPLVWDGALIRQSTSDECSAAIALLKALHN